MFIILSMIPAALVGVFLDDILNQLFEGQLLLVSCMLLVTGALLMFTDKFEPKEKLDLTYGKALLIGIAQAVAILPGISRSGATISTSLLLNVDRSTAARFSFLMVVPLIFGKIGKDLVSGNLNLQSSEIMPILIGFISAFISGLLACKWMILIVKKSKLSYFSIYCGVIGCIAIGYSILN